MINKYNICDKVWYKSTRGIYKTCITCNMEEWVGNETVIVECIITKIETTVYLYHRTHIRYWSNNFAYEETELFATKEDAEASLEVK